jgi:hypothetical protein
MLHSSYGSRQGVVYPTDYTHHDITVLQPLIFRWGNDIEPWIIYLN